MPTVWSSLRTNVKNFETVTKVGGLVGI